jgi:hypothetical protein
MLFTTMGIVGAMLVYGALDSFVAGPDVHRRRGSRPRPVVGPERCLRPDDARRRAQSRWQ